MALALIPLLWALQDWALALSPASPNVCSYWESFTTPSKESYVQPFAQAVEAPCERSPRPVDQACPRHKVLYKVAYRQGVKLDYRRRYRCCQGYYESSDLCVPRCTQECVHGRCVAPDHCQCEPGWRGPDCSRECGRLLGGPTCKEPCPCTHGAGCDPPTEACSCQPGLRGPACEEPCPPGSYGPSCLLACQCEHGGTCDAATGACNCSQGHVGPQ